MKHVVLLAGLAALLVGCGSSTSTPIAPDLPEQSAKSTPPANLEEMKKAEHADPSGRQ